MNIDEPPSEDFADADKEDEGEEDENRSQTSPMDVATSQVSDDDSENENENENGNDNENGMEDENENGNDNENGMENGEEQDNEGENENDGENEDEDVDMDAEGGEADQENGEQSASPSTQKSSDREPLSSPPRLRRRSPPALQPRADSCSSYDIVPCLAAPHATSVNAITATTDMRWVFTGGSDGYIRKFDHFAGMNGKVPLTVAQKHPFVDSVTKAGVLLSYWENEEPPDEFSTPVKNTSLGAPKISAVYCLAVHSEALWLLSGLESGGINLQTVRHEEGKVIHCLKKHTSAVSVLQLTSDEQFVLSGGWDRQEWDLNTGFVARSYPNNTGQISSIRFRPSSSVPIYPVASPPKPVVSVYDDQRRGSLASNNSLESLFGDESPNGTLNDAMLDSVIDNDQPTTQETVSDPSSSGQQICRDIFLTSSFDGGISLWDRRRDGMVARLATGSKGAPPWCTSACWSANGDFIYAGRRNGTVDEYSMHKPLGPPIRTFRFPGNSGPVTSLTAMPNGKNLICASYDNLRLYDLTSDSRHGIPPFWIIPGHQSGTIAAVCMPRVNLVDLDTDPTCRFMLTAGGNRGWGGATTEVVMGYDIGVVG